MQLQFGILCLSGVHADFIGLRSSCISHCLLHHSGQGGSALGPDILNEGDIFSPALSVLSKHKKGERRLENEGCKTRMDVLFAKLVELDSLILVFV